MQEKEPKKRSKLGKFLDKRGISQKWLYDQLTAAVDNEMAVSRWCSGASEPDSTTWLLIARIMSCSLSEIK